MQSKFNIVYDDSIEKLIMAQVFKKQIRMKDMFQDYDPLRKGTVTEDKFRSSLVILGIHLKEKDIQQLLEKYKTNLPGLFDYTKFCQHIDKQFFDKSTGKDNLRAIESRSQFTVQEEEILTNYLNQIKEIIKNKRILLKPVFMDFDKTRNQHVTYEQFKRVLAQLRIISNATVLDLISRKYMDLSNDKDINYLKFCQDADDVKEMTEALAKENPKEFHYTSQDVYTEAKNLNLAQNLFTTKHIDFGTADTEKSIKAQAVMKHLRIEEFFYDFDKLRKGVVTKHQFRRVIDQLGIKLSEAQYKALIGKYLDHTDRFRWMDFCNTINQVFTKKGLEKDPLKEVNPIKYDTTLAARRKFLDVQDFEKERIKELIKLYQKFIMSNRCYVKLYFKDFDKTYTGFVTKNQFLRILAAFNLFPSESDTNLLLKHYMNKGNLNEVNYYDFCSDIEAAINEDGVSFSQDYAKLFENPDNRSTYNKTSYISNANTENLDELMKKLQITVNEQRIRISEFLKDFDKLRSGTLTIHQLRLGFNMAKIQLSDTEFDILKENFSCVHKKGYVWWMKICDQIDLVHTTKGLETQPNFTKPEWTPYVSKKRKNMKQKEIDCAERCIERFRNYSKGTRLNVKQFFKDWDRLGTHNEARTKVRFGTNQVTRNKVSPKQFRQVLATVKFSITDLEYNALVKMYGTESGEINYLDFVEATQPHYYDAFTGEQEDKYSGKFGGPRNKGLEQFDLLLDKIRQQVKVNRLRVKEYFMDFDPLRKGIVQYNKFRGVLSKMNINLTEEEMILLEKHYMHTAKTLNYFRFIEDIEIVFTKPHLQKYPQELPTKFVAPNIIKSNVSMTKCEEEKLEAILKLLGGCVFRRRILLKPFFYDKDQQKSGKVSFTRFRSILDFLNLKLTEEQFNILCKRFSHQAIEFNYYEFDEILKKYADLG